MQARNNARIMITGSIDMFSNRYVIFVIVSCTINVSLVSTYSFDGVSFLCDSGFSDQVCRMLRAQ